MIALPRRSDGRRTNVVLRRVTPQALRRADGDPAHGRPGTSRRAWRRWWWGGGSWSGWQASSSAASSSTDNRQLRIVGVFESAGRRFRERMSGPTTSHARQSPWRPGLELARGAREGPGRDRRLSTSWIRPAAKHAAQGRLGAAVLRRPGRARGEDDPGARHLRLHHHGHRFQLCGHEHDVRRRRAPAA